MTNDEYNQFLTYLVNSNQSALYEKYKPDISGHSGPMRTFFKAYHFPQDESHEKKYRRQFEDYPIVNISHEAAEAYCEWLTQSYNQTKGRKKFQEVRFRLPQLKEWQIAALGYKDFQSWDVEENTVEVGIPKRPGDEIAVKKRTIPVKGNEIFYPWYFVYAYRNTAQNIRNCWLGNFKIPEGSAPCFAPHPAKDGFPITGEVGTYFPNGMGLFDVVGNVAEMIGEKGKACGGSWDDFPEQSTILSVKNFDRTSGSVGFRVFMEVINENVRSK